LAAAAAFAQQAPTVANTLVTSTHTPTAEAPAFGTPVYFRRIWTTPTPKARASSPMRLDELVNDGKLELSLRSYLDAVLANNTDIQISRLNIELPRNAISSSHAIFDPQVITSFNATRRATPSVARIIGDQQQFGTEIVSALQQPFTFRAQQMLPTGTTYAIGYDANRFTSTSVDGLGRRSAPQIQNT
jgi:outer membrane protein TolC